MNVAVRGGEAVLTPHSAWVKSRLQTGGVFRPMFPSLRRRRPEVLKVWLCLVTAATDADAASARQKPHDPSFLPSPASYPAHAVNML